jgi:hypothetical protein
LTVGVVIIRLVIGVVQDILLGVVVGPDVDGVTLGLVREYEVDVEGV